MIKRMYVEITILRKKGAAPSDDIMVLKKLKSDLGDQLKTSKEILKTNNKSLKESEASNRILAANLKKAQEALQEQCNKTIKAEAESIRTLKLVNHFEQILQKSGIVASKEKELLNEDNMTDAIASNVTNVKISNESKKCRHFEMFNWCNKNEKCPLLHPTRTCLSFRNGTCSNGSACALQGSPPKFSLRILATRPMQISGRKMS